MDQRVQTIIDYLKANLHQKLSVSDLARRVNLSSSYLGHLFKAETGLPPAQYLKSLRMQKAEELLATFFLSVKEIMRNIGINDESHFVRNFKKAYDLTPAQYRESHRSLHQDEENPDQAKAESANK
jgi:AraC-like DNA-binding protein